jgi:hypothetical protein
VSKKIVVHRSLPWGLLACVCGLREVGHSSPICYLCDSSGPHKKVNCKECLAVIKMAKPLMKAIKCRSLGEFMDMRCSELNRRLESVDMALTFRGVVDKSKKG